MQNPRSASTSASPSAASSATTRAEAVRAQPLNARARRVSWALQLLVAAILGQTLFFKFGGAAESVFIFESLGAEPWGRWLSGLAELAAVLLLLAPGCAALGALLALGILSGALGAHLVVLGIEVQGDGGLLFALALSAAAASAGVIALRWSELSVRAARARALLRGTRAARGAG
jgi:putative oxidoreductase